MFLGNDDELVVEVRIGSKLHDPCWLTIGVDYIHATNPLEQGGCMKGTKWRKLNLLQKS